MKVALLSLPLFALLLGATDPAETRELFAVKEFPSIKVMVPADKAAWCSNTARVTLLADSGDQLVQNRAVVEKIVGGIRAVMSFECPEATRLQLTGKIQGQPLYEAFAVAANGWKLEGDRLKSAEQLKLVADMEAVGRCDDLGSGPGDSEAITSAVADDAINGGAVVIACRKAIQIDPDTPRLKYQLARGLLKQGDVESAVEQLVSAGEAGHGGSLALLGDIYLNGSGSVEADPVMARSLYQRAVEAGFEPAKTVLAGFEDQTQAVAQAEAEEKAATVEMAQAEPVAGKGTRQKAAARSLNPQGYEYPDIIQAIYSGDYDDLSERGTKIYLVNMASTFQAVCRGSFSINEINKLKMAIIDKSDLTPQAGIANLYNGIMALAQITQDPGRILEMQRRSQSVDSQPQQASSDAMLFVERYNCNSPAFNRFTANIRTYVQDTGLSANVSAPEYRNACMVGAQPNPYSKGDFCGCFIARASAIPLTRREKKGMLASFWPTATEIMRQNADHFAPCNGSFSG